MIERIADKTLSSAGFLLLVTAAAMIMFADLGQHSFSNTKANFAYHTFVD
jgi:hypothetical protein